MLRSLHSQIDIAEHICPEEDQVTTLLYRPQRAESYERQGRLRNPVNVRMYGLEGEACIFLTLDASSEYWQVDINHRDKYKEMCTSHHGLYRFYEWRSV